MPNDPDHPRLPSAGATAPLPEQTPTDTTAPVSITPRTDLPGSDGGPVDCERDEAGRLTRLGRFEILGEIGRGGMGIVLEARDPRLRRRVAIKIIRSRAAASTFHLDRFVAEAQITGQLQHPGIIPVHEMGSTADGARFFVMTRVQGASLAEVLRQLRSGQGDEWSRNRLLGVFVQICNAVAYAHDRGVLHRDLKPANVMLGAFGEVLVLDWGIARLLRSDEPSSAEGGSLPSVPGVTRGEDVDRLTIAATRAGAIVGTPEYMSPEQLKGQPVDERSDVWSLGAILYALLTHSAPFQGAQRELRLEGLLDGPPEDPRRRRPDVALPDELVDLCMSALATNPEDRPQSTTAFGNAVRSYLEGSKRREQAEEYLDKARQAWAKEQALQTRREELARTVHQLEESLEPWTPLHDKTELLEARRELSLALPLLSRHFAETIGNAEKALSRDEDNRDARAFLASVYFARFEQAERRGDEAERVFLEERVLQFDDGHHAALLRGLGALTLRTDPPGAEVLCERFDTLSGPTTPHHPPHQPTPQCRVAQATLQNNAAK